MIVSTPALRGIPVYEDATMPHRNDETGEDIHMRVLEMPGMGTVVLCSPSFLLELKEKYSV